MSTMRCTPSFFGAIMAALLRCKRYFMLRGYSCLGAGVSAALAAFCAFCSNNASTAVRSKSSPNFRAVIGFVLSGVRYDNLPRLSFGGKGNIFFIQCGLSFPLRPILTLGDTVLAPMQ